MYDGATAIAEAAILACHATNRKEILVARSIHPHYRAALCTYARDFDFEIKEIDFTGGVTAPEKLQALASKATAAVIVQNPNFFGSVEDLSALIELTHAVGALFVTVADPIALGLLEAPGKLGSDMVVGEGQPLGIPMSFGGPYLGFMACVEKMQRKLPGRIVGQTSDSEGRRCFVLTLQAREQHIRREKASSNICSNEALCALTASVYMAAMGPRGMRDAAEACFANAHYLAERITALPGFDLVNSGEFFHEFVTSSPICPEKLMSALEEKNILGGLPVEGRILWCATEMNTAEQIETLVSVIKEAVVR